MPKQREPIDLIIAKGRKHFTKADIERRRAQEPNVPFKNIKAPKYLSKPAVKEFYDTAYKLLEIGVMTELDEDALARYIVVKQQFLIYTELISEALSMGDSIEAERLSKTQDKFFKQVRAAASDLGLTITSRCKLVVPEPPDDYVDL